MRERRDIFLLKRMKENSPKTSFELMLPKEWVELVKSRKEDIPVEGRSVSRIPSVCVSFPRVRVLSYVHSIKLLKFKINS